MPRKSYEQLLTEIKQYTAVINDISDYNDVMLEKQLLDFIAMNPTTISYGAFINLLENNKILCTKIEKSFSKEVFPIKVYKIYRIPESKISEKYLNISYITSQWFDIRYNKLIEKTNALTASMDKYKRVVE